ncbi:MAG: cupin domain-containing protein [Polyangiaceae bacterium]
MRGNLFDGPAPPLGQERFETLATIGGSRVERIRSGGALESMRYSQEHDEWVVLVAGHADVEVDGERCSLGPGDWLLLPAHTPHALLETSPDAVWVAVHAETPSSVFPVGE